MIKEKLIELSQENLAGGDAPASLQGKYHKAIIELYLGMAYADIIQEQFDNAGTDYTIFDNFSKSFGVDNKILVKFDSALEQKYIDLPCPIIPLRPKQAAIRAISMLKGQQRAFAPIQGASIPMWSELEAMRIDDTVAYKLDSLKLFFPFNAPELNSELLLTLICPFENLDDTDEVFVPGGKNEMVFERMYNFMIRRGNSAEKYNENTSVQTK